MKIVKTTLKQTSLTCPSAWVGQSDDGKSIDIFFRTGQLLFRVEGRVTATSERDQFDVSSFMELEEALALLLKVGIESE